MENDRRHQSRLTEQYIAVICNLLFPFFQSFFFFFNVRIPSNYIYIIICVLLLQHQLIYLLQVEVLTLINYAGGL